MQRTLPRLAACLLTLLCIAAAMPTPGADAPKLDINQATVQQLTGLPGIGEAIAQRIVDFRKANGPFRRIEDLLKVKGIGEKSLEKLRPHVRVGSSR